MTELDQKILQMVLDADEPISSKKLAAACGVAINTVRKEIELLNREIRTHGLTIEMKSSVGIYPMIWDEERAIPYLERMRTFYVRSRHMEGQYAPQVYYLARRCLRGGADLTIPRLCEELYCSRGTILRELGLVKEILAEFHLELKNRRGGLEVVGSEWNIRQCLIFQHKMYIIRQDSESEKRLEKEYSFRALFFMDEDIYQQTQDAVRQAIQEQTEIALPILHLPKVANLILLCVSRRKQGEGETFFPEQTAEIEGTPEYQFVRELCAKLPARLRDSLGEKDCAMVTAMLLGFGDRGNCFDGEARWAPYLREAEELIDYLAARSGFSRENFDRDFYQGICHYLHRLHMRQTFGVVADAEAIGQVRQVGMNSANLALLFARFYQKRHGVCLRPRDAMESFYLFQRVGFLNPYCCYAQRILVVSEYGMDTARLIARMLEDNYGSRIERAEPREFNRLPRAGEGQWDLLVTDLPVKKMGALSYCKLPILSIEYPVLLKHGREQKLDVYLKQAKQQVEQEVIRRESFHRVDLKSKEEVFAYLEETFRGAPELEGFRVAEYLRENDGLVDLERQNGVVVLPIFSGRAGRARVEVLLNRSEILWNRQKSRIFVCCVYDNTRHNSRVLSQILQKFIYMSPETKGSLLREEDRSPLLLFYPDE